MSRAMMRTACCDVGIVAATARAGAQEAPARGALLPSLYASFVALETYDGYSTTIAVKRGAAESNSVMRGIAGNSAALWSVKAAATAASIVTAERLWRRNRRIEATVVMILSNAVAAAVAARNAAMLQRDHGR